MTTPIKLSSNEKADLTDKLTKLFTNKPMYKRIPKAGMKEFYKARDRFYEDFLKDKGYSRPSSFAELLEIEGLGPDERIRAIDNIFIGLESSNYNFVAENLELLAQFKQNKNLEIPTPQLLQLYVERTTPQPTQPQISSTPATEQQRPPQPPPSTPLPRPPQIAGAGGGAGAGAGAASGDLTPPRLRGTPRTTPQLPPSDKLTTPPPLEEEPLRPITTPRLEPIDLPPLEQPPRDIPIPQTAPINNNPLSTQTALDMGEEKNDDGMLVDRGFQTEPIQQAVVETQTDPPRRMIRGSRETQTEPLASRVIETQTDPRQQAVVASQTEPLASRVIETQTDPRQQAMVGTQTDPRQQAMMATQTDQPPPIQQAMMGTQTEPRQSRVIETQTDQPPQIQQAMMSTQTEPRQSRVIETQTDPPPPVLRGSVETQTDRPQRITIASQTDPPPPIPGIPLADMSTQTDPNNVSLGIDRRQTMISDTQQPSKIDLIPRERLSSENKTIEELLDDLNYFYQNFPNELKNIPFDNNNRNNIEYLKRKHKEIVAKLTVGRKEEKIGIIISGSEYIKEKLKEIILENSINGLSAKDLIINIEKKENKQSSDVNSYEFKIGIDGKPMAKKEPIYKYIPEVVQEPVKTKPARIPNTQTKFRSLVTTARRETALNPFSKPQPKIRLKYSY